MDIVKNIKKIRLQKGINQDVIADALGVDNSVISNIENGKRELKVKELEVIAKCLEEDVIYLFTYPRRYACIDEANNSSNDIKAIIQIELKREKKDQVMKLIFGENNLEILNK